MKTLALRDVTFHIGDATVLDGVDLTVGAGTVMGLVGPNGSGKSTLLRLLYRDWRPQGGRACLGADDLWTMPRRDVARVVAAVPQEQPSQFELTVADIVRLGRLPHQRLLAPDGDGDERSVADAIAAVGLTGLEHRHLDQLSGGERQRAVIARALAQQPTVLLLDEPTNHLDIRYQHDILGLVRRLALTTLIAVHDLNLAAAYCDGVTLLHHGRIVTAGTVGDVLVPEWLQPTFGIAATLVDHPTTGVRQLLFHPAPQDGLA